ncbi:hypothetical protein VTO42DRAFT_1130 [Malbranchea cinnamomea]
MFTRHSKTKKPVRLLTHLPLDHLAQKASPITTLQKLRAELVESLATAIKAVQHIPTGVAITVYNSQDAQIEKEKHWITCIIPDLPSEYLAYDGGTEVLTTEQAVAEFEL